MKEYVENGGILYFSGAEDTELLKMLLGSELKDYTEETSVYLAPAKIGESYFEGFSEKYPLPIEARVPMISVNDADVLATLTLPYTKPSEMRFASIHSNPPGIKTDIPALVRKKLGKGTVIWSAAPSNVMTDALTDGCFTKCSTALSVMKHCRFAPMRRDR